ncbi:D-2-hydroxyacid dehydrogenase [Ramlibacter sp.]|uniref:D-2-hydroxyacid dehydrogenase n=1 Tax=Ramlibacter sp. TaxID=1917967 RepID=UPI002BAECBE2|nr:D-2-hydroxyacid dehydrogenase [Ramlibacter sp.]HWI84227.1 D-2-hydroxyacid dehydrogenase [Ramlibacter sp.]
MTTRALPPKEQLTICFAHAAYRMQERFQARNTAIRSFEVRSVDELRERIGEADALCVSGFWRNEFVERARRLVLIQSISAGTDQYSRDVLGPAGIRVASAQGVNERAVAEHAIALILAIARKLPLARDNQSARHWRGLISDIGQREDELGGKTLVIVGMGRIGSRLATLAKAFDMRVIGVKRDPSTGAEAADRAVPQAALLEVLPQADFVALTCPLNPSTQDLIDAKALAAMKPTAALINVARGKVVHEPALVAAMRSGALAAAALDCVWEEPLPAASPLWELPNTFITPHSAGETRKYEENVIDLLLENLQRLWRGETRLKNDFV